VMASDGRRFELRLGGEVDPSGQLPDGRTFADIDGLRKLLLKDEEQLAYNFARQLAVYATGKGYRFSDRQTINSIVAKSQSDAGVRRLIEAVVLSPLFTPTK
jgi:hypothetical protein